VWLDSQTQHEDFLGSLSDLVPVPLTEQFQTLLTEVDTAIPGPRAGVS
jgi:hypothetical protein